MNNSYYDIPKSFFTKESFRRAGGMHITNHSYWDSADGKPKWLVHKTFQISTAVKTKAQQSKLLFLKIEDIKYI